MQLQEVTLQYGEITLTVRQADGYHGVKMLAMRSRLMAEQADVPDMEGQILRNMKALFYPICIASTVKYEGMDEPQTFEAWIALPDDFLGEWQEKALEVNPHWSPFYKREEIRETLTGD